jgi:hypothetical protein
MSRLTPPEKPPIELIKIVTHIYDELNRLKGTSDNTVKVLNGTVIGTRSQSGLNASMASNDQVQAWLPQVDSMLDGDNTWTGLNTFSKKIILGVVSGIQTDSFVSGMMGKGFGVYQDLSTGRWTLEVDDLRVRGRMSILELLFQQVRANNGSFWVSSTAKVSRFSQTR